MKGAIGNDFSKLHKDPGPKMSAKAGGEINSPGPACHPASLAGSGVQVWGSLLVFSGERDQRWSGHSTEE